METQISNSKRLDIIGNGDCSSDQEIFTAFLKRWRQKLRYCSIFAAVPAILVSNISEARSDEPKRPEVSVAGRTTKLLNRLNKNVGNADLLKRQSRFRLPHRMGRFNTMAAVSGNDDCPGQAIPAGNYTASAPYLDSGNTTGANNTISFLSSYYYYYSYDASGPDHVYSFTLTGRGSNPKIEVSGTNGAYTPLIYILPGGFNGACPDGTGHTSHTHMFAVDSRWSNGNTATFTKNYVDVLPLHLPLYLFIDSSRSDSTGYGPYTIRMQDVTINLATELNPIDTPEFFVRQQYLDFFGREPDQIGFQNWVNTIRGCPNGGYGELDNPNCDRVHVSAGFYQSEEFQVRGYWAYRFYEVALDRRPTFAEFIPDMARVGGEQSPQSEATSKAAYTNDFVLRQEFRTRYDGLSNAAYLNALEQNAEVTIANKQALLDALNAGTKTRAAVLRETIESQSVSSRFFNRAFVSMQYFGYLRRDPDTIGFQNWVNTLDADPSNFRHMIFGFIYSTEYRSRFGKP